MKRTIRLAQPEDSGKILEIYAPFVRDTAISFEEEVPTPEAFAARVATISSRYPYLVGLVDGEICGYAYASRYRERAAYRYDVEVSIYVAPEQHRRGVAYRLYDGLFRLLKELGYYNAYAAYTEPNAKSRKFHEKFGFKFAGTHSATGRKLGTWHDVTWLEKHIREHDDAPGEIKLIGELPEEFIRRVCDAYVV